MCLLQQKFFLEFKMARIVSNLELGSYAKRSL